MGIMQIIKREKEKFQAQRHQNQVKTLLAKNQELKKQESKAKVIGALAKQQAQYKESIAQSQAQTEKAKGPNKLMSFAKGLKQHLDGVKAKNNKPVKGNMKYKGGGSSSFGSGSKLSLPGDSGNNPFMQTAQNNPFQYGQNQNAVKKPQPQKKGVTIIVR